MSMQKLESKCIKEDNIAEQIRMKETKAVLAAAKEGMEHEVQHLRLEKEVKQKVQQEADI
eukprot:10553956-Ditylum_brightwellii.AAC.1